MKKSVLYSNISCGEDCYDITDKATYKGITIKTVIFLLITCVSAIIVGVALPAILENNFSTFMGLLIASSFISFIAALVGRLSYRSAKYAGAIYSLSEGIMVGSVSALLEMVFPGIATVAVFSTLIIFGCMFILFATGLIKGGKVYTTIFFGFLIGALALTLFTSLMSIFNADVFNNIGIVILVEAVFLIYGVLSLTFNFLEARSVVDSGCSKNAEWSVALGLEITLIYIYIELLRILFYIYSLFGDRK